MKDFIPTIAEGSDEVCGSHGFIVNWIATQYSFDFIVKRINGRYVDDNSMVDTEDVIEGHVKWDGCANIQYFDYAHYCEPQQLIEQHHVLRWCYKKAKEVIPGNDIDAWPDDEMSIYEDGGAK